MKRLLGVLAAAACLGAALVALDARAVEAAPPGTELPPPATGGIAALDPLLHKLTNNRRLLIVGAHPDDENSQLLAVVSRKLGGEAAYLSLTRGEGGQNLIGDELGVGLGLIRTQELLAARRLDGARQYFTRAYDFGYSKSLDEALRFWPKAALLEDAVRVIRRFRPQIVFVTFTGTPRDGHGQHQASAVVAREAYRAAGDAAAFRAGGEPLPPWMPKTLLRSNWFDPDGTGFPIPTGDLDPLLGKSYLQIAVASRSLHRSQGTGALQRPGPGETGAIWVDGAGKDGTDLFAGVDTRLRSIAAEIADPARRARAEALLDRVETRAVETRRNLAPARLSDAVEPITAILADLRAARAEAETADGGAGMLIEEKIAAAEEALAASAGVVLDALAETETASPTESFATTVSVWNAGARPVAVESVALASPDGWKVPEAAAGRPVAAGKLEEWKLSAAVPAGSRPTVPYFLEKPLKEAVYDWSAAAPEARGEPFQKPPLAAVVELRIGEARLRLSREVTRRIRDEAFGEIRHALRAVPRVEVSVDPAILVWPMDRPAPRALQVTLTSNSAAPVSGAVEVSTPSGWSVTRPAFALAKKGDRALIEVPITRDAGASAGRFEIPVAAVAADGARFDASIRRIDYEHIRPTSFPRPSAAALTALDLKLPALRSVGYVRGASDRVPESLAAVGLPIHVLTPAELEQGDLSKFEAIVVGSRAYETEPALARANARLLDYVRGGGLVIVQYQQYPFVDGGFAPAKLEIARPHDRVTDETAKVTLLDPKSPIFTAPNPIGPADWDGWVQERGLYYAHTWDASYTPLLEMADPGGEPLRGGLLAARIGKGRYIYTGLAFFRQLPAGVPGAYRLFANLLAWK
ncbi:MAG TPA: PIG-L family deacetylase [Thermoanaerobaculia bacterium]